MICLVATDLGHGGTSSVTELRSLFRPAPVRHAGRPRSQAGAAGQECGASCQCAEGRRPRDPPRISAVARSLSTGWGRAGSRRSRARCTGQSREGIIGHRPWQREHGSSASQRGEQGSSGEVRVASGSKAGGSIRRPGAERGESLPPSTPIRPASIPVLHLQLPRSGFVQQPGDVKGRPNRPYGKAVARACT
jgi:hypothetical protein